MPEYDYDLFVIGAGSGGVRAARIAAMSGAKVAVAEESRVGGTCVIRGCVPKKFMVYASEFAQTFQDARGFGWTLGEPVFDWTEFRTRRDMEVARLSGIYEANLAKAGCDLIRGRATFIDPHTLEITAEGEPKRRVTAAKILIAAGGRPKIATGVPGIEHAITSDEVFDLPELPKRMMIVGGGYIAVEFASVFARPRRRGRVNGMPRRPTCCAASTRTYAHPPRAGRHEQAAGVEGPVLACVHDAHREASSSELRADQPCPEMARRRPSRPMWCCSPTGRAPARTAGLGPR